MNRKKIFRDLLKTAGGLIIFGFGSFLTIKANIGLAPWESLSMGISLHIPFSYGLTHMAIGIVLIVIDLLLKEKIGYGTILDAIIVGLTVDAFTVIDITPQPVNLLSSIGIMVIGLFIMGIGQYFYMAAGLSCGPRDAFLVAIGKRLPRIPIGAVNIGICISALLLGYLLGAPVGIGTILSSFGVGIAMQIVFMLLKFEPRSIQHKGLLETTKILLSKH